MGVHEAVQLADVPPDGPVNENGNGVRKEIPNSLDDPVVPHFQAIDFHDFNQAHFFFLNQESQENGQGNSQTNWEERDASPINYLAQLLVHTHRERHKYLPRQYLRLIEKLFYICLVHLVLEKHNAFNRPEHENSLAFVNDTAC